MKRNTGSGDKHNVSLQLHGFHHQEKKELKDIPKGCLAIMVGQGEEQQRFVIPVIYINHPLFMQLLKVAEEEYGFDQKGPITIPCHVEEFRNVQGMIDKDHHHHHVWCFRDLPQYGQNNGKQVDSNGSGATNVNTGVISNGASDNVQPFAGNASNLTSSGVFQQSKQNQLPPSQSEQSLRRSDVSNEYEMSVDGPAIFPDHLDHISQWFEPSFVTSSCTGKVQTALLDEKAFLACIVRTIPTGGEIWINSTLPNRLGKMLAPLHWHDYKKKYRKLDDFVANHRELYYWALYNKIDYIQLREGAQEMIAATTVVAKVVAATAAMSPHSTILPFVVVTPIVQPNQLKKVVS
ncbi:hypothetical protein V6N11_049368 [Hibiscus sabdariffa]|uniref:DUF7725 domain-containing protein n=1 Tax=Hibiscus sabdariffa TaxID=183260 RepID=A0ABR2P0I4_9ROSI